MTDNKQVEQIADLNVKEYIGKRVKELRKKSGFAQESLAEYLNMTRTSIVNIEQGRQGLPMDRLYLVCCFLHCTPNDLFPEVKEVEWKYEDVEITVYERVPKTITVKKLIV
jgi:transcriptional regulator with XRE-family HTH domain